MFFVSKDERRSYGFGTSWGWVTNDRIFFIFEWTIPLIIIILGVNGLKRRTVFTWVQLRSVCVHEKEDYWDLRRITLNLWRLCCCSSSQFCCCRAQVCSKWQQMPQSSAYPREHHGTSPQTLYSAKVQPQSAFLLVTALTGQLSLHL